jgi:hypothetical protein
VKPLHQRGGTGLADAVYATGAEKRLSGEAADRWARDVRGKSDWPSALVNCPLPFSILDRDDPAS